MALGGIPLLSFAKSLPEFIISESAPIKVYLFSKHLQFLNYMEMSEAAAEMGFDGLDLTVRSGGHIDPGQVLEELPKAVKAMENYDLQPGMMTTSILDASNTQQLRVLETASRLGITHYRTGWLKYPDDIAISEAQEKFAGHFRELETINRDLGLIGCYQNHSGAHVGAPVWDIPQILKKTQNTHMGMQYDIRHAVVEGSQSWELGLRLVQPHIKSIVIKDFKWGQVNGKWQPVNTPLGKGMVDFKRFFSLLKQYQINVPISLHLEYYLGGAEKGLNTVSMERTEIFRHMKTDLNFLRTTWEQA
ncbi:sugar phosphate isomerase/epimerase [Zeaxanthinibacter sp. PT1]|uniref:sugar phosphate isomerase/epimerase family protein n=1 Tax=Zeaxanthinibacter TaxID=561554 RepID=UPI002349F6F3|nr:sugar phosphate isomerase/epimerase family protein [Zeaxanthinibacter sp. PT1]MDC6352201.1 sugar phosphate isomerase/epimerase [Zeaxanthinibacter sp. PT1]